MDGFGEVDLDKGTVVFNLHNGRSNIESQQSPHERFSVNLDKPKCTITVVSDDKNTYHAYIQDGSGLVSIDTHGIIGKT